MVTRVGGILRRQEVAIIDILISELRRLWKAAANSVAGWAYLIRQPNIIYLFLLAFVTPVLGRMEVLTRYEVLFLLFVVMMAMVIEIVNTGLELTVDLIVPHYSRRVKLIKDLFSAGVFFALISYLLFLLYFLIS